MPPAHGKRNYDRVRKITKQAISMHQLHRRKFKFYIPKIKSKLTNENLKLPPLPFRISRTLGNPTIRFPGKRKKFPAKTLKEGRFFFLDRLKFGFRKFELVKLKALRTDCLATCGLDMASIFETGAHV